MSSALSYDAIVIGGGYFGCACGYYLAKSGARVLLLDKAEIGRGASGANFGCVQVQDDSMGLSLELTLAGFEMMQNMEKELDCSIGYAPCSSLIAAETESHLAALETFYKEKLAAGLDIRWLDNKALQKEEPNLNPDSLLAATYFEQGHLYPFHYLYALIRKGRAHGLEVRENCAVASLLMEGGQCKGVVLENGDCICAEQTVVTTGSGTHALCLTAGLDVPVLSVKSECFVTEPVAPLLRGFHSSAGFFEEAHDAEKTAVSFCMGQTMYGNLLLAETSKPHNAVSERFQDATSPEQCYHMQKNLAFAIPATAHLQILRGWVTASPYTESNEPIFGRSPIQGLILAAGFKSAAVLSALVGTLVTDMVLHNRCRYDLSSFMRQVQRCS